MSDYTILIRKHNYYDVSRYSESSGKSSSDIDSISDISLSDHELQLKEVLISSEFNQDFNNDNCVNDNEFDNGDNNSNDDDDTSTEDYNEQNDFDQKRNKSSFKTLSFVCTVKGCSKKYTIKGSLKRHIRHYHTEKKSFVCFESQCLNIKFPTHDLLKRHQQKVHGNKLFYVCKEKGCDEKYGTVNHLRTHQRTKGHENEIQSKEKCAGENQKQHISINHVRKQIYRCINPGCDRSFDELLSYVNHLRIHPGGEIPKVHHCDEPGCNKTFTNLYGLWNHTRFGHSKEILERAHKCEESGCDRSFDTLYGLWVHKRSHIRENPELGKTLKNDEIKIYTRKYPCKVPGCNRIFDSKSAVASHNRFHKTDRTGKDDASYKCDVPEFDKTFEDHVHLENNKRICNELGCSQTFQNSQELNHQQTHTDDKLGQIEVNCDTQGCNSKIENFEALKQHLNDDHNTKSYHVCDKKGCNFGCTDNSNFLKHQQTHVDISVINAKEELFKCENPECDKVYKRLCHLRTHQNRRKHQTSMFTNKQNRSEDHHMGKKNYACDEPGCDKIYKRLCRLKKHKSHNHIKTLFPYVYIENINFDIKQKNTHYCDHPGCFYATKKVRNLKRHKMVHTEEKRFPFGIGNKVYASDKVIAKGVPYNLRKRDQISHKVLVGRTKTNHSIIKTKPRLNVRKNFRIHSRLNKHACNHQGCNKRFITLIGLKKHKDRAHSININKNVRVPIVTTNNLANKKRSGVSDDKLKGGESNIYPYRLRKRPRINKINMLNDDDDECLCKFTGCRKIFDSIRSLKIHQRKFHMITKTYSCGKTGCNFRTKFSETLERHQIEKHRIS